MVTIGIAMTTNTQDIKVLHEKERLSDGSHLDNIFIRWNGGFIKVAPDSEEHAKKLYDALQHAAYMEVTVY